MLRINKPLSEKETRKIGNERGLLVLIYWIIFFLIIWLGDVFNTSYHTLSYIVLITVLLIFFKDLHDAIMYQTLFKIAKNRSGISPLFKNGRIVLSAWLYWFADIGVCLFIFIVVFVNLVHI